MDSEISSRSTITCPECGHQETETMPTDACQWYSGRTLYEVQAILGHSDPKVTQRYAHLSTKALQEAANAASAVISGASRRES